MAAVDPQTTQLEFYQAMADFKTMFPSMDDDVIEAVLRSNKGAVDATIDQLLAMSTDYENEKIRMELDIKEQQTLPQPDVNTAQLVSVDDEPDLLSTSLPMNTSINQPPSHTQQSSSNPQPLSTSSKWSSSSLMLGQLPDDFLRLAPDTTQSEMEMEDERIAALLQNEEFMKELRWNKDFISTLDRESCEAINSRFPLRVVDDEAAFKERLKHMGKLSKKKFSQLGRVFTGRKKKGAKSILNENATKDNLLLKEDQDSD